jgi:hypothetical protein
MTPDNETTEPPAEWLAAVSEAAKRRYRAALPGARRNDRGVSRNR